MKDIKYQLKERIEAYNQKWTYEEHKDMAAVLLSIIEEAFIRQQNLISQISTQQQHHVYNFLEDVKQMHAHPYIRVQFLSENNGTLEKNTLFSGRTLQDEECVYRLCETQSFHTTNIHTILCVDGTSQKICGGPYKEGAHISLRGNDIARHALCFKLSNFFTFCEQVSFDLYLDCEKKLLEWIADSSICHVYALSNQQRQEPVEVKLQNGHLHMKLQLHKDDELEELWIEALQPSIVSSIHVKDAYFMWEKKQLHPDFVTNEEQICHGEEIAMFTSMMNLQNICYVCANEVFSKQKATIQMRFEVETRIEELGMDILQNQPYRAFMRKLPLELPVYDAYAQLVLIEYFNGSSWVPLPDCQGLQGAFQQDAKQNIQASFSRPDDVATCTVLGKEGYYIRFRLVKSDHLYQRPCRVHIPYLSHMRFSYQTSEKIRATQTILYEHLQKKNVENTLDKEGFHLFHHVPTKQKACYFALQDIIKEQPICLYFDISYSEANGSKLHFSFLTQDQQWHPIRFQDFSDGFSHSGEIMFVFPYKMEIQKLFEIDAYWMCMEFEDGSLPDIHIQQYYRNTGLLQHVEGGCLALREIQHTSNVSLEVQVLEGPFGALEDESKYQIKKRLRDHLRMQYQPLSKEDLLLFLKNTSLDIADVCILEGTNKYNAKSKDTHVIVLFQNIALHHTLYQMHKQQLQNVMKKYHAYIKGNCLIEEPIFVKVHIQATCICHHDAIWKAKEELLDFLETYLDPIHSQHLKKKKCIGMNFDETQLIEEVKKAVPSLSISLWQTRVSFLECGKEKMYLWKDLPRFNAMVMIQGAHRIEVYKAGEECVRN